MIGCQLSVVGSQLWVVSCRFSDVSYVMYLTGCYVLVFETHCRFFFEIFFFLVVLFCIALGPSPDGSGNPLVPWYGAQDCSAQQVSAPQNYFHFKSFLFNASLTKKIHCLLLSLQANYRVVLSTW